MIYLSSPRGLGDALYLRAVVLHVLRHEKEVCVFTAWQEVFADLPVVVRPRHDAVGRDDVRTVTAYRDVVAGVPMGHSHTRSDFSAACANAGIDEPVALEINWPVRNHGLVAQIRREAGGREVLIYQPLKRTRNRDQELLTPRRESFCAFLSRRADCYRVKLGHPPYVVDDPNLPCEMDLCGKGFIYDTFDACSAGDMFFSQNCFINIMAEALGKPYVVMFARAALDSSTWVSQLTPERAVHKKHLGTAIYD